MRVEVLGAALGVFAATPLLIVCSCALFGDAKESAVEAATCSPKADIWYQVELARVCGEKETDECPAAVELRARYLELEAEECSSKP